MPPPKRLPPLAGHDTTRRNLSALLPGKSKGSLSTAMIRMVRANLLEDAGYGLYRIPAKTPLGPGGESGADTPDATRLTLHEGGHGEESD